MPLQLTVSCFSKIQIGFTFLVPAHPGSPGHRAIKRVCVCVCIPSPTHSFTLGLNPSFSANPPYRSLSFFFIQVSLYGFPRLFTVTSEHIRLFTFSVFTPFLVVGSVR